MHRSAPRPRSCQETGWPEAQGRDRLWQPHRTGASLGESAASEEHSIPMKTTTGQTQKLVPFYLTCLSNLKSCLIIAFGRALETADNTIL